MTQFTGGQVPFSGDANEEQSMTRDVVVGDEMLPSAGDTSGLTAAVREQLDADVRSAGGADQVVAQLNARIAEIDAHNESVQDPEHISQQAERALLVAQISYLEAQHGADPTTGRGEMSSATMSNRSIMSDGSMTGERPVVSDTVSTTAGSMNTAMGSGMRSTRRRVRTYNTN